jgi:hypothetical protein
MHIYPHLHAATSAIILPSCWVIVVFAGEAFCTFSSSPLDAMLEFLTVQPPFSFPVWVQYKWWDLSLSLDKKVIPLSH